MIHSEKKRSYWYIHILAIILILIVLYFLVTLSLIIITRHNREHIVPDFTQKSIASALVLAEAYDLRLEITDSVYVQRLGRGLITKQNPKPGNKVKKNRRIRLTINSFSPKESNIPSLIGYSLRQAKTKLISEGLSVGKLIYKEDMATNNVLSQMYEGKEVKPGKIVNSGSEVDLVLGMNKANNRTYIPTAFGYTLITTKDMLIDNSLNIGKLYYDETVISYSDSLNAVIYRLTPAPSDSISHKMGRYVHLYLTINQSKVPIIEEEEEVVIKPKAAKKDDLVVVKTIEQIRTGSKNKATKVQRVK